jgi:alginate O-acetyltransferase complex protein AlgI
MNFASVHFFYFFLIVFGVYFTLPDRWRNAFLLAASYFFYAYWSVKYLVLLVFTMVLDYLIALRIDHSETERERKYYLTASIIANLGVLFVFKYFNLFTGLFAQLLSKPGFSLDLILPFGISFYTFHAMSYTIDVYRRVIPAEKNFTYYSGYVMFFPQLVAGPIARASHLLHQFSKPKRIRVDNLVQGSWMIAKGFVMKLVIADHIAPFVDAYYGNEAVKTPFLVLQAVYLFSFQIYFDFSGYTEMARGIAKLFDFDLSLNFARPYASGSITEFWRRWHISLSTWLRDYLYISLGGNRGGKLKTYRNLLLTMLLGGLWHGANWTFLVWGAIHGLLLAFEKALSAPFAGLLIKVPRPIKIFFTFNLVTFAWIYFRSASFSQASEMIRVCTDAILHPSFNGGEIQRKLWFLALSWSAFEWAEERFKLDQVFLKIDWKLKFAVLYAFLVVIVLFAELNPKAFIYFQF